MLILTEGHTRPTTAKTAACLLRYRPDEVVAILDSTQVGGSTRTLLGVPQDAPIVGRLDDAPEADTLVIGIAPSGGKIPAAWKALLVDAVRRGMHLVSGLHEFLHDDPELVRLAREHGVELIDVRKNQERDVAQRQGIRNDCLRIQTIGNDCSVGKMLVAVELTRALQRLGHDTKFVATGQTGIMIEGDGCPVDCVVSDFLNGAVEKLVLANQHHDILLIEGQGSLAQPRYSAVTAGLLHGAIPHGMILCYECGRTAVQGMPHVPLPPLSRIREAYENLAGLMFPSRVIGVAMNSRNFTEQQTEAEREQLRSELGLPICDVVRHGADELVQAVLGLQRELLAR